MRGLVGIAFIEVVCSCCPELAVGPDLPTRIGSSLVPK